ncbi:MAG: sn-glycerol-3-phosphate ABC transporter ATP-binding protein UgpC [Rubrivivax sp.]
MASVQLRQLVKDYGETRVVHGIDLSIAPDEFVALVGPSGCGKSTTLRMIAGLEDISDGEVLIDGEVVNERAPKDRDIAMVFQDYALYPHMSVFDNLSFGLSVQKVPKTEIEQRVRAAAEILNITDLLARKPRQLSGGQRQRVAMGRAIVRRPKVFLFDEPLSNLDAKLRVQMRTEIKKLHQRIATTVVYVTHDQVEAMTLADRIVVMRGGYIEQVGTPDQVYNHPASVFVAGFIGSPTMNVVPARLADDGRTLQLDDGATGITLALTPAQAERCRSHGSAELLVGFRPETVTLAHAAHSGFAVRAEVIEPLGSDTLVFFSIGRREVVARLPPSTRVASGDTIHLSIDAAQLHLFDGGSEKAI